MRPQLVGPAERLGLPARAVEGHHELEPEPLAQRMLDHESVRARRRPRRTARARAALRSSVLHRDEPQLLEAHRFATCPLQVGELVERRAPPQRERAFEERPRSRPASGPRLASRASSSNSRGVDAVGRPVQHVAGRAGGDVDVGCERLAEPRHVALDGRGRRGRRIVTPQGVGEPVDRHDRRPVRDEHRQRQSGPSGPPIGTDAPSRQTSSGPRTRTMHRPVAMPRPLCPASFPRLQATASALASGSMADSPEARKARGARCSRIQRPITQQRSPSCRWCR